METLQKCASVIFKQFAVKRRVYKVEEQRTDCVRFIVDGCYLRGSDTGRKQAVVYLGVFALFFSHPYADARTCPRAYLRLEKAGGLQIGSAGAKEKREADLFWGLDYSHCQSGPLSFWGGISNDKRYYKKGIPVDMIDWWVVDNDAKANSTT